ncbi:MAG: lipoprotein signal peptidase [Proteobacteria bacterium]|nr:signal peptidase II [Pseudomonadota bacterium]NOG61629.1 lipoprotein signal peptidase [Pseudomonadota bacterium]
MPDTRFRVFKGLALSLAVIILDQLTKFYAVQKLELYESFTVFPGFNFMLTHNTGAAFSFLSQAGGWQRFFFIGLGTVVSIILIIWMKSLTTNKRCLYYALALVLGGVIGNVWDRIVYGYVIDFIDVSLGFLPWQIFNPWPTFNIADSAIFIGAFMLIIDAIWLNDSENDT